MVGIRKQAVHQYQRRVKKFNEQLGHLICLVDELRAEHPGCGVEKMYNTIQPDFIGRDQFIDIFMDLGYRVQKPRNYIRTTIPGYFKYPNLIEGLCVYRKNQLWQSDITYFDVKGTFYYIVFIMDVYTRKILSYQVSSTLRAEANIAALKQALKSQGNDVKGLIHHSDRGSQYIDKEYLSLLARHHIHVSMGLKGQENAYVERVNGIIKNEYLKYYSIGTLSTLKTRVRKAAYNYNHKRLHKSLPGRNTPVSFEKTLVNLSDQKRPTVMVYAEGGYKIQEALSLLDFRPEKDTLVQVCPIIN